jgi:hypothetical protein
MYLDYNGIGFEGYSALANGEWEHLKDIFLFLGRDSISNFYGVTEYSAIKIVLNIYLDIEL